MYAERIIDCPRCNAAYSVGPDAVGQPVVCPACGQQVRIEWAAVKAKKTYEGLVALTAFGFVEEWIAPEHREIVYLRLLWFVERQFFRFAADVRREVIFQRVCEN